MFAKIGNRSSSWIKLARNRHKGRVHSATGSYRHSLHYGRHGLSRLAVIHGLSGLHGLRIGSRLAGLHRLRIGNRLSRLHRLRIRNRLSRLHWSVRRIRLNRNSRCRNGSIHLIIHFICGICG